MTLLTGSSPWPGLAQVFQVECQAIRKKTGERREAVVAGVTSLASEEADAARWLALVRGQGHSEHQWHGMRDVPLDEERFQVRCGNSPQGMAALRHPVMGLMRWAG